MAVGGDQTYALVAPEIMAVSSSEITLSWSAPVDTGKSPVTGYRVYMFDDVGLNSQADPEPVKHEIQARLSHRWEICLAEIVGNPRRYLGIPRESCARTAWRRWRVWMIVVDAECIQRTPGRLSRGRRKPTQTRQWIYLLCWGCSCSYDLIEDPKPSRPLTQTLSF